MMKERIGVYICECGPNIKDSLRLPEIKKFAQNIEGVETVTCHPLLCSKEGKEFIRKQINDHGLNRVVIAACSPKEHERTFWEVLKDAGLNPFYLQMANVREQCAWVVEDKDQATEKAKSLLHGAINRVGHHEFLETLQVTCQADVLVVGAGIAGISTALTLAQRNRNVFLIEKSPCIGGKAALYEDLFPTMECASCVLNPRIDAVLHNDAIKLFTMTEVKEVLGFYGNFQVEVQTNPRFVDSETCIGCGACLEVCPVNVNNEFNQGMDERKAIHIPYDTALPNVALIDAEHCLHMRGQDCNACKDACPFGSIDYGDTPKTRQITVGAIVLATGFDVFDPKRAPQYAYGKTEGIYTSLEFERILNATGPTRGKLQTRDGKVPQSIALIHCVGSRTPNFNEYCSGICCSIMLKFSHQITEKWPHISITHVFSDLCLPGKEAQRFYHNLSKQKAVTFVRMNAPDAICIREDDKALRIEYEDPRGRRNSFVCDMAVLGTALESARGAEELGRAMDTPLDPSGYFGEENVQISMVGTSREGIFVAGCAQGPKDIQTAVTQGQAAAGAILSRLIPGEQITIQPMTAVLNESLCSGCRLCIGQCPFKAIALDKSENRIAVNKIICRGCGSCAAACPSGAIRTNHFTDEQISAEIRGVMN